MISKNKLNQLYKDLEQDLETLTHFCKDNPKAMNQLSFVEQDIKAFIYNLDERNEILNFKQKIEEALGHKISLRQAKTTKRCTDALEEYDKTGKLPKLKNNS